MKNFSLEQLAEQYSTIDEQSQMMKGLILLAAKERLPANKEFGEWVKKNHALCVDSQQVRNRYMNLARFFKNLSMNGISLTAAYHISKPDNELIAEEVYYQVRGRNLKIEEVDKIIREQKSKWGLLPILYEKKPEIIVDKEKINQVLELVNSFNFGTDAQVKFLKQCILEIKSKDLDHIDD